jgi:ketosteroid isomerase-like protein
VVEMNADDLAELYAVDAVHELPFLFPGMPDRYDGREAVREAYRSAWNRSPARPQSVREVSLHATDDPEVVIVEQVVCGVHATTGEGFEFPGVLVLRVRAGQIVHVRDYMDGLEVARAMGRLPEVEGRFGELK